MAGFPANGDGTWRGYACPRCQCTALLLNEDGPPECLRCFTRAEKRDVDLDDQRRVLAVLADARFPMKRRAIEEAAFGRTGYMVWRTIRALSELESKGLAQNAYDPYTGQFHRCWKVTEKGREQAPGVAVFHPSGGAS